MHGRFDPFAGFAGVSACNKPRRSTEIVREALGEREADDLDCSLIQREFAGTSADSIGPKKFLHMVTALKSRLQASNQTNIVKC
jgi:hypothetical protein